MSLMRTSVNTRISGGNIGEAVSIGKTEQPSLQEGMEIFNQTSRWKSPLINAEGEIERDLITGAAIDNPLQRGFNLYGVRLPGHELRAGVTRSSADYIQAEKNALKYDVLPGQQYNVYTLDIESTGLHPLSQTREISVLHRIAVTDENGNTTFIQGADPANVKTWNIKTNKMDAGVTYETIGGVERPIPLSETAFAQSGAREGVDPTIYSWLKEAGPDGAIRPDAETAIREAFEMVMGEGRGSNGLPSKFSLHNNNFDIGFMVNNLLNMGDELKPETVSTLKRFVERRANDPHFVVDSLNSVSVTINQQLTQQRNILEKVGTINEEHINKFITDSSIDRSLMQKAEFTGQGATQSSVENAILNTNLLSIIEEDAIKNPELLKALERGTHTGAVDVVMQAYIEQAISDNRFKIQRSLTEDQAVEIFGAEHGKEVFKELNQSGFLRANIDGTIKAFSEFEKHFRRKATKSSAITLTTNVKDVNLLSESGFQYLSNTQEGMGRISLDLESGISMTKNAGGEPVDMLQHLGLDHLGKDFEGKLRFNQDKGNFYVTGLESNDTTLTGGMLGNDFQEKAQSLIKSTLEKARNPEKNDLIHLGVGIDPIETNMANDLLNIRMTHMEHTELTQMHAARMIRDPSALPFDANAPEDQLLKSLTHTSNTYREKGKPLSKTVYYGDLLEDKATERIDSYIEGVQQMGLPYADISPASRVSAVETSRATSDIGKLLWKQHAATLPADKAGTAKNISEHIHLLEEFGQTYMAGQGKESQLGLAKPGSTFNSEIYSRIPLEGVEQSSTNFIIPSSILGKLEVDSIDPLTGQIITDAAGNATKTLIGSEDYLAQANHTVHYSLPSGQGQDNTVNLIFKHGFSQDEKIAKAQSEDLVTQILRHVEALGEDNFSGKSPIAQIQESIINGPKKIQINKEQVTALMRGEKDATMPEGAATAYRSIVEQLGETLRNKGIISFSAKDEAGKQLRTTLQETLPEIFFSNTDVEAAKHPSRISQWFGDMLGARISPMKNQEGAVAVESLEGVSNPQRAAQITGLTSDRAATEALEQTANRIAEDSGLKIKLNIAKKIEEGNKFEPFAIKARQMWGDNRGKVAIGAAVIGTALLARHLFKKHRENQQYESTMMMSEPEQGQRPYGAQEALLTPKAPQSASDPLATAGVVGNLDRRKVGHTNMSPQKNAHLFRG